MKYFTRAWAKGELSDAESERRKKRYWRFVQSLRTTVLPPVADLATEVNLHDGLIRSAVLKQADSSLTLELIVGDLQVGYHDLTLSYGGVDASALDTKTLGRCVANPGTEILYDEVDVEGEGRYVHRVLFWPDGEIDIMFTTLSYQKKSRPDRSNPIPRHDRYREDS